MIITLFMFNIYTGIFYKLVVGYLNKMDAFK